MHRRPLDRPLPRLVALVLLCACSPSKSGDEPLPDTDTDTTDSDTTDTDVVDTDVVDTDALDPELVEAGKAIFRYDDFGDWRFWTDVLHLDDLVETVTPATALGLGLKVDVDAVPPDVLAAVLDDPSKLDDPAVTLALLDLDAVLGVKAEIQDGAITRIGVTCALCHSTVDDSVTAGIGHRMDGWANTTLAVGPILSLTPGLPEAAQPVYAAWLPGRYDPRFSIDGLDTPIVIPPAYGLRGVPAETYSGDGPVSYWNAYVAVTQMHGHGNFADARLGIEVTVPPGEDEVTSKLPALRAYQLSLEPPPPPPDSFDAAAAARGEVVFRTDAGCASCHAGPRFTSETLVDPAATQMDPAYAARTATGKYRVTPLRGLWQHAPYFHDGSAATLGDVVDHYVTALDLDLSEQQRADLEQYLRTL